MTTYRKYLKDSAKHNANILIRYAAPSHANPPNFKEIFKPNDELFRKIAMGKRG